MTRYGDRAGVVIIGAGHAGYQTAESLRQEGYEKPIILISDEPHLPYHRPPLSKNYLLGETDEERLRFRSLDYYSEQGIDLLLGVKALRIDRENGYVLLDDDREIFYADLVLATGARVRRLSVPGTQYKGVYYLRALDDIKPIETCLKSARNVVVIGAGFIGLEFAAVARKLKKSVTILEVSSRVLARAVSPDLSKYFSILHQSEGVEIVCEVEVSEIIGDHKHVTAVMCTNGKKYNADIVVIGVGVIPNIELAEGAGINCNNGIFTDEHGRTEDAHIYAAGDCAAYQHPFAGKLVRLESVQNANDQGRSAAAAIANQPKPYESIPWFWSIQYNIRLQMVGLYDGCDQTVIRGHMDTNKFALFHYREDQLRAVHAVNRPADYIISRKLLTAGVSPRPEQVGDGTYDLKKLIA